MVAHDYIVPIRVVPVDENENRNTEVGVNKNRLVVNVDCL